MPTRKRFRRSGFWRKVGGKRKVCGGSDDGRQQAELGFVNGKGRSRRLLLKFVDQHCMSENEKMNKFNAHEETEEQTVSAFDFLYLPMDFKYVIPCSSSSAMKLGVGDLHMLSLFELRRQNELDLALKVFEFVRKEVWYDSNLSVFSDMILLLGKNKLIEMAEQLFSELKKEGLVPDTRAYTELIGAYLQVGVEVALIKALEKRKFEDARVVLF
ncbi:uncharacterized protein LOC132271796 isoform X2 [Cornus florida]|uniref:uncharacterized protein LOC132271796 isoform X2 n=1 Tax=Cornus florida TaxID=4283 RepID=UPI00289C4A1B|nr:uncharacterized protein LOC132271796 isoform X2 [Cornus florida]